MTEPLKSGQTVWLTGDVRNVEEKHVSHFLLCVKACSFQKSFCGCVFSGLLPALGWPTAQGPGAAPEHWPAPGGMRRGGVSVKACAPHPHLFWLLTSLDLLSVPLVRVRPVYIPCVIQIAALKIPLIVFGRVPAAELSICGRETGKGNGFLDGAPDSSFPA